MKADEFIARALEREPDDPIRPLLIGAAINLALGRSFVIVGGTAVNFHTGVYQPTDIDFVGPTPDLTERQKLIDLGFDPDGRHLVLRPPGGGPSIPIEFPSEELLPFITDRTDEVEVADGVTVEVISLNDLLMDRVVQATDGTPVTNDDAVRLAVAAYAQIDWSSLEDRAADAEGKMTGSAAQALPATLKKVRNAARRRLREARRSG
jgi:hypothetical protein